MGLRAALLGTAGIQMPVQSQGSTLARSRRGWCLPSQRGHWCTSPFRLTTLAADRPDKAVKAHQWKRLLDRGCQVTLSGRAHWLLASPYSSGDPRCLLVQTSAEISDLSLSAIEQCAGVAKRDVVVIDQSDEFLDLFTHALELRLQ